MSGHTYLEPYEDEIPKADHGKLGGSHAAPRVGVLNRDDMHDVYEPFHREQWDEKPDCVSKSATPVAEPRKGDGSANLPMKSLNVSIGPAM